MKDAGKKVAGEKHNNFPRRFGVELAASEEWVFLGTQPEPAKPAGFKKCSSAAKHQK